MFISLQQTTGSRITSLSKQWRDREEELRKLGQSDELICPHCKELVTFRCGEINRPHFAHRQDTKCPLKGNRSPQEIEAKAQLYEALEHTWPDEVQMDVMLDGETQPIDILLLKNGEPFAAYWTLSRTIRNWDAFTAPAENHQIRYHIIYTGDAHKHPEDQLILQKQQRDQIHHSQEFDSCEFANHGHLSFIDIESSQLVIYRGLTCVHSPNGYQYELKRTAPLRQLHINTNGELITSEDISYTKELAILIKQRQEELHRRIEEKHRREREEAEARAKRLISQQQRQQKTKQRQCIYCHQDTDAWALFRPGGKCVCHACLPNHKQQNPNSAAGVLKRAETAARPKIGVYTCVYCKKETSEWSIMSNANKTCVCKECLPEHNRRRTGK